MKIGNTARELGSNTMPSDEESTNRRLQVTCPLWLRARNHTTPGFTHRLSLRLVQSYSSSI
jgi:hypothetical protein